MGCTGNEVNTRCDHNDAGGPMAAFGPELPSVLCSSALLLLTAASQSLPGPVPPSLRNRIDDCGLTCIKIHELFYMLIFC